MPRKDKTVENQPYFQHNSKIKFSLKDNQFLKKVLVEVDIINVKDSTGSDSDSKIETKVFLRKITCIRVEEAIEMLQNFTPN